jgi:mannan endo-1,4-beta-mannosidase
LSGIVSAWVANAAQWKTFEKYLLINIANEWGPENSPVWRDEYIKAIAALRAAGLNSTIVVDSGGCGQDDQDVILYGADVFNSDPQKNVVFDVHIYGGWQEHPDPAQPWFRDINKTFDAFVATGLPILIGEFGPGRNIGPSPTLLTPGEVITAAESHGFGWLAWAWDDPAGEYTNPPRDDWFALSFTGDYKSSADLTTFGKEVVENPTYGLKVLGRPASIF